MRICQLCSEYIMADLLRGSSKGKTNMSISKNILKKLAGKPAISLDELRENIIKPKEKYAINRSIKNLELDGYIENLNSDNKCYFRLTKEGRKKLHSIKLDSESSLISVNWDGYWRIILLDLPEERKNERNALRYLLKKAGFVCLKNSVWISMYPFEHLFNNIKKDLGLSTELIIIVTDKLDEKTEKDFFILCGDK